MNQIPRLEQRAVSRYLTLKNLSIVEIATELQQKSETALPITKPRRIPVPAYSPDLSPTDFFLFGMLKE
jgi:hypothetical protein